MSKDQSFLEQLSRLADDAATAAEGLKQDVDVFVKTKLERALRDLDTVEREEFEILKAMVIETALENDHLKARLNAHENHPQRNRPIRNRVKKKHSVRKL